MVLTYMDTEDCGRKRLLKDLKKKAEKGEAKLQVINGPNTPLHRPSSSPKVPKEVVAFFEVSHIKE